MHFNTSHHTPAATYAGLYAKRGPSWIGKHSQRVHVGIWYILRAQRGSHIPTLRPKYIPYSYMDPLGLILECCTWFCTLPWEEVSPRLLSKFEWLIFMLPLCARNPNKGFAVYTLVCTYIYMYIRTHSHIHIYTVREREREREFLHVITT